MIRIDTSEGSNTTEWARRCNRIHVAPPLNISDSDAATGLAVLDEALGAADGFLD